MVTSKHAPAGVVEDRVVVRGLLPGHAARQQQHKRPNVRQFQTQGQMICPCKCDLGLGLAISIYVEQQTAPPQRYPVMQFQENIHVFPTFSLACLGKAQQRFSRFE